MSPIFFGANITVFLEKNTESWWKWHLARGTTGMHTMCVSTFEDLYKHHSTRAQQPKIRKSSTSWWLNQPIWKICSSNWIISPRFGVKIKNIRNHHRPFVDICLTWKRVIFIDKFDYRSVLFLHASISRTKNLNQSEFLFCKVGAPNMQLEGESQPSVSKCWTSPAL